MAIKTCANDCKCRKDDGPVAPDYSITPTREELYEALERATDALAWTVDAVFTDIEEDISKLRICRAVAVDVRKMLDARPKL